MKLAIAFDERARSLRNAVLSGLVAQGHDVLDLGTSAPGHAGDYASQARRVADVVLSGRVERAILLSSSALGASFVANKIPGIHAAVGADAYDARRGGENGVNVACLGSNLTPAEAMEIVCAFAGARARMRPPAGALRDAPVRAVVAA